MCREWGCLLLLWDWVCAEVSIEVVDWHLHLLFSQVFFMWPFAPHNLHTTARFGTTCTGVSTGSSLPSSSYWRRDMCSEANLANESSLRCHYIRQWDAADKTRLHLAAIPLKHFYTHAVTSSIPTWKGCKKTNTIKTMFLWYLITLHSGFPVSWNLNVALVMCIPAKVFKEGKKLGRIGKLLSVFFHPNVYISKDYNRCIAYD